MLRQIANIFSREDQQQLGVDGLNGGAAFAEAPGQCPLVTRSYWNTSDLRRRGFSKGSATVETVDAQLIELAAEEHRVQIAAVEPVLLAVQRLADDVMHLRVHIKLIIRTPAEQLNGVLNNHIDLAIGSYNSQVHNIISEPLYCTCEL
jgi:hypothetical protein